MNDLDEFQDEIAIIRHGLGEIRYSDARRRGNVREHAISAPSVETPLRPHRQAQPSGTRSPLVAVGVSLIVLVLAMIPVALLRSGTGNQSEAGAIAPTLTVDSAIATTAPAVATPAGWDWTSAPLPPDFRVHTIAALDGRFFGLAPDDFEIASDDPEQPNIENPEPRTRLWVSDDGIAWQVIDINATAFGMRAGYFVALDMIGDTFIARVKGIPLIEGDVGDRLVFSTDARTWVPAELGTDAPLVVGIAGSPDSGVALTRDEEATYDTYDVWHSTDGATWTQTGTQRFSGVSGPAIAEVNGSFYIGASEWVAESEPPALWISDNAAEWTRLGLPSLGPDWAGQAVPAATSDDKLVLATAGRSPSQLWITSDDGSWAEVTPPSYAGDLAVRPSDGGPVLIVGSGQSGGPEDPEYYRPASLWWSLDGTTWAQISVTDAFGTKGTIQSAAANQDTVVIVHYSHPDWIGSLQIGTISE
ncbi:MAG: hypothetical protein GY788_09800 [bacterium]|nr:hypothetical protein [bacterium]